MKDKVRHALHLIEPLNKLYQCGCPSRKEAEDELVSSENQVYDCKSNALATACVKGHTSKTIWLSSSSN